MKHIITTVGTSLISNFFSKEFQEDYYLKKHNSINEINEKIVKGQELSDDDRENLSKGLDCFIWKVKKEVIEGQVFYSETDNEVDINIDACAEIKSIIKIANNQPATIHLLCTDTDASVFCAERIQKALNGNNQLTVKEPVKVTGLSLEDKNQFETTGIDNLIEALDKIYPQKGEKPKDIVLNISGGYKALIPVMTIIGQIKKTPIFYIYENSDDLIEIPKVNIEFDYGTIVDFYEIAKTLKKFRLIADIKNDLSDDTGIQEKQWEHLKQILTVNIQTNQAKLTILNRFLLNEYQQNETVSAIYNVFAQNIELKLYKYFVKEWKNATVTHSKEGFGFEYDVYIETESKIVAIEIKPGGNVPLWEQNHKDNNGNKRKGHSSDSLEYRINKGGFKEVDNKITAKQVEKRIYLYRQFPIHPMLLKQIEELHTKYPENTKNIIWYWIKSDNYNNCNWSIENDRIEKIFPLQQS